MTLSTFSSQVTAAFGNNLGGSVNFETGFTVPPTGNVTPIYGNGPTNTITATFGTGSVGFYRNDADAGNSIGDGSGFFGLQPNNNNGTAGTSSGANYLGFQGGFGTTATPSTLNFTSGVSEVGLTLIPRGAARTITLTAVLDNGSTLVSSTNTVNTNNTASNGTTTTTGVGDIFYGFVAPTGRTITGLRLAEAAGGFSRFDDLAFIIPAATPGTPEPASLSLLGLGGLVALRRKRA